MGFRQRVLPLVFAAAAFGFSAAVAWLVNTRHVEDRESALRLAAARIERRVADHVLLLNAIKGLMVADRSIVRRDQLSAFLAAMPEAAGAASAQGFGFALATATDRSADAKAIGQRSYPAFHDIWPATEQHMRTPIVLLEPQDARNAAALGFDMFSEAIRREAMERAISSRGVTISRPVKLVQEIDGPQQAGALIYLPLFRSDGVISDTEAGVGDLVGFVYAPIRVGTLVRSVIDERPALPVAVEVYSEVRNEDALMFASGSLAGHDITVPITVADRIWMVRIANAGPSSARSSPAVFVIVLGSMVALLAGMLARAHFREVDAQAALAAEVSAKNESNTVLLGEMQHRIKNSIARKLALFRLSVRETADRDALIRSYEARMQAMAKAQDLLLTAPDQGKTIGALLDDEIGAWRAINAGIRYGGPDIRLDGSQLQALALIFHELTTNSLKYGALAHGGPIAVDWTMSGSERDGRVELTWSEATPQVAGSEVQQGFGSRLIRLMAEGQLGGTATRRHSGERLTLIISFPRQSRSLQAL